MRTTLFIVSLVSSMVRMCKPEAGTYSFGRIHANFSSHLGNNAFADRKSKSCTLNKGIELHKTFKYALLLFFRYSHSGVAHIEFYFLMGYLFISQGDTALLGEL